MASGSNKPSRCQRIVAHFRKLNGKEAGWYGDNDSCPEERLERYNVEKTVAGEVDCRMATS